MLLLGIDVGTSSIKVSVVDADSQQVVASAQYPDVENPIQSPQEGWAEQEPAMWWTCVQKAISRVNSTNTFDPTDIAAIGIGYQMHGLVLVDEAGKTLRPSIIWCDSRAVSNGDRLFRQIGEKRALSYLLNSPGNFTAAKLAWVMENEPDVYAKAQHLMLPGDYIALRLTGEATTSNSALSEGIFWDFNKNEVSEDIINALGFRRELIPPIQPVFGEHGRLRLDVATDLGLKAGIPVTYKAGDQPNNALSLNVLEPGEVAATAGTSGVIYAVTDQVAADPKSRVNTFAHVNHRRNEGENRLGVLLCINGTGSLNRWMRDEFGAGLTYADINDLANQAPVGSDGIRVLPFGNGAERILENRTLGAMFNGLNFNIHNRGHVFRAAQEGIAFSLKYGLDIMAATGTQPAVIRAGKSNLFLSDLFTQTLVNASQTTVELFDTDGAKGAALGAGIGLGVFAEPKEAFTKLKKLATIEPDTSQRAVYQNIYENWKELLTKMLTDN
ncbi:MAG: carbohydrate kinase [Cytophagaceae bacterium]|nr:carbohydrate kinase [Cytophagaceae bacterium]